MLDQKTLETRARMACRLYLALFDAGDFGSAIRLGMALGRRENSQEFWTTGNVLIADLIELDVFRKEMIIDDRPHYAIHNWMRTRMSGRAGETTVHAERLRADLQAFDQGKPIEPRIFSEYEVLIRAGDPGATPI